MGEQLLLACRDRRAADALRLIDAGAALDAADARGDSAIVLASAYEELDAVAARLIARGADVNRPGAGRGTALLLACSHRRGATALLLVAAGAELDRVGAGAGDGRTALDWAVVKGLGEVVDAIRARGGRTGAELRPLREAASAKGRDLLAFCAAKDAASAAQLLDEAGEGGVDLDFRDEGGCTALMRCCVAPGLDGLAARLVKARADVNAAAKNGATALVTACVYSRAETAMLLLDAGAAPDRGAMNGRTALDYAAERQGLAVVAAEIRARGGHTAAELAAAAASVAQ